MRVLFLQSQSRPVQRSLHNIPLASVGGNVVSETAAHSHQTKSIYHSDHGSQYLDQWRIAKGIADQQPLIKIARATMSRPEYFSSTKVHGVRYEDGGRDPRNPGQEAAREIIDPHNSASNSIDWLVSVGCGNP